MLYGVLPAAAMAAPSKAEVEELIRVAVGTAVADVDRRFGGLLQERVSRQDAEAALTEVIVNARQEFVETSARIDNLCKGLMRNSSSTRS